MNLPYQPLNMTVARWRQIPVRTVPLSGLLFSQDHLYIERLLAAAQGEFDGCGDPYPHLVRFEGQTWVVDGHHRIVVAMIWGRETVRARVLVKI